MGHNIHLPVQAYVKVATGLLALKYPRKANNKIHPAATGTMLYHCRHSYRLDEVLIFIQNFRNSCWLDVTPQQWEES